MFFNVGGPNEVNGESCDSKEQNPRKTYPIPGSSEPVFEQRQEKDSISQINTGPAPDNVSVSKTVGGKRHKIRQKKYVLFQGSLPALPPPKSLNNQNM